MSICAGEHLRHEREREGAEVAQWVLFTFIEKALCGRLWGAECGDKQLKELRLVER